MLAAVALAGMTSAALASDGILNGSRSSALTTAEMAAIQGEGSITVVQISEQKNSTGTNSTNGQVQQANQNVQQVGFQNVAANSLSQDQKVEIEIKKITPPPAKPTYTPKPPKWWKR